MPYFELASNVSKIAFSAGFLSNTFLIYLTVFHVKSVFGTYKKMVIIFSILGITFSSLEILAKPFAHNINNCVMYFSVNMWIRSQSVSQLLIAIWAGLYLVIVSFVSVQFIYRHCCLSNVSWAKKFDGLGCFLWMGYPLIPGAIYASSFYWFCLPDEYSDDCMRETILINYDLATADVARFTVAPYTSEGSWRLNNSFFLLSGVVSIWLHYSIILYCGVKMHLNMKEELKMFSVVNRKLQRQFFKALVFQSIGPTVFLVLPVAPIVFAPLVAPYLSLEISWQTGWMYSIVGMYPPFDSVAFMLIVTEYRKIIRDRYLFGCTKRYLAKNVQMVPTTGKVVNN